MIVCHCMRMTDRDILAGEPGAGSCCGGCIACVLKLQEQRKKNMERDLDDIGFELYQDGETVCWEISLEEITDVPLTIRMTKDEMENLLYQVANALEELSSGATAGITERSDLEIVVDEVDVENVEDFTFFDDYEDYGFGD